MGHGRGPGRRQARPLRLRPARGCSFGPRPGTILISRPRGSAARQDRRADLVAVPVPRRADRHQQVLRLEAERRGKALAAQSFAPRRIERSRRVAVLHREPHVFAVPTEAHPRRPIGLPANQLGAPGRFDQRDRGTEATELPVRGRRTREAEKWAVRATQPFSPAACGAVVPAECRRAGAGPPPSSPRAGPGRHARGRVPGSPRRRRTLRCPGSWSSGHGTRTRITVRVARSTTVVSSRVEERTSRCSVEPPEVGIHSFRRAERRKRRAGSVGVEGSRLTVRVPPRPDRPERVVRVVRAAGVSLCRGIVGQIGILPGVHFGVPLRVLPAQIPFSFDAGIETAWSRIGRIVERHTATSSSCPARVGTSAAGMRHDRAWHTKA